ncbi:AMP-dependent synthetase [Rhodophyticola sp. CCM32]|uniref:class I adenylate-forming enzyme family protein n=1 Tax=Rhodophyticola sp. CCM32 TaxID=2916397 RepID=UPI00107EFF25|nr:class I adenylate-forming enzyme family protein [Rhodophyticola sp. CCM32]QBY01258.1 AMP-dependent synthetase [Rhodophyticola sp. CCM32]
MLQFGEFAAVTTIGDLLLGTAQARPDVDALVFPDDRRSFSALAAGAMRRARGLYALGVRPGDHVGILLPSCIPYAELFFATALLGAISVPINARYRSSELRYILRNADLKLVVTTGQVAEKVNFIDRLTEAFPDLADQRPGERLALADAPKLSAVLLICDAEAPGFLSASAVDAAAETVDDAVIHSLRRRVCVRETGLILYTSGTTSHPKGCMISHEALVRTGQGLATRYQMTSDDVFWSPLPMFHIGALFPICASYSVGATYVSMPYFEGGEALRLIEEERATIGYPAFGTFIADMIYHPDFEQRDLSALRLMNSNMAMQPPSFRKALQEKMPDCIQVGTFGMTETSGTVTTSMPGDSYTTRTERLGKPLDGLEVRIVDENGRDLPAGEIGEILVRGFSIFSAYYKDADKTAEVLRDGWFHSGDLGSQDGDGTLLFHGRLKDMLKVGGENVAAQEIENLVGQHEAVKLCQVVGRSDPRLVEVPVAVVELVPGASVQGADLIAFCKGKVASFKVPRDVHFVTEWPMSASKIQKFKLREMVEGR